MELRLILNAIKVIYPNAFRAKWLHNKRLFVEFEVQNVGIGVYSVYQSKIIFHPSPITEISIDDKMGWILCKYYFKGGSLILNFQGHIIFKNISDKFRLRKCLFKRILSRFPQGV